MRRKRSISATSTLSDGIRREGRIKDRGLYCVGQLPGGKSDDCSEGGPSGVGVQGIAAKAVWALAGAVDVQLGPTGICVIDCLPGMKG